VQSSARKFRQKKWGRSVGFGALLLLGVFAADYLAQTCVFADSDAPLKETARKLAERVAGIPGLRGPLRLEWHPDEHWAEGEDVRWRETLRDEFARHMLPMSDEAGAGALSVYAQQTPAQLVLTAKTRVGDREEVRIVAIPRAGLPPVETTVRPVRLQRQLVYQSLDRILDAASLSNNADGELGVLLYKNFEVVVLRLDAKGEVAQTVSLNVTGLKPARNPHGELAPLGGQVSVQLWGKSCDFSWDAPAEVKCRAEKAFSLEKSAWRMGTVLTSPCDESHWTISGGGNDPTAREVLRLMPDGASEESSATVMSEFPGPVWNVNAGQSGGSALVVARNLQTGNYEVYKIMVVCGG